MEEQMRILLCEDDANEAPCYANTFKPKASTPSCAKTVS